MNNFKGWLPIIIGSGLVVLLLVSLLTIAPVFAQGPGWMMGGWNGYGGTGCCGSGWMMGYVQNDTGTAPRGYGHGMMSGSGGYGMMGRFHGYNNLRDKTTSAETSAEMAVTPDVAFTLQTNIVEGRLVYVGVGGIIDGVVNPDLRVKSGDVVQVTLVNGDGAGHDIAIPDFDAHSDHVVGQGASTVIVFRADQAGTFPYYCTLPGHRQIGMEGQLMVGD